MGFMAMLFVRHMELATAHGGVALPAALDRPQAGALLVQPVQPVQPQDPLDPQPKRSTTVARPSASVGVLPHGPVERHPRGVRLRRPLSAGTAKATTSCSM